MKKHLRGFGAILTAGIMVMSVSSVAMASDIIIAQDTNIDVQQSDSKKNKDDKEEKSDKKVENESWEKFENSDYINEDTSESEKYDDKYLSDLYKQNDDKVISDNENNLTEKSDTSNDDVSAESESSDDTSNFEMKSEEDNLLVDSEVPENIEVTNEQIGEDIQEEEIAASNGTNVNIENTNYVEINNNTGTVYVNIYNGIGVDVQKKDNKEADVNVFDDTEIAISGNETSESVTDAAETVTEAAETITVEEVTEITTDVPQKSKRRSSGGGSSSRRTSSGKSSVLNKQESSKEVTKKDVVEAVQSQKEKKAVAMTIGSRFMNVNGEAVETDSAPYISNSYTLCPLRCISTVFDAEVEWDKNTKTAIIKTNSTETRFTINSDTMLVNGKQVFIPKAAEIKNGRTYVPLRVLGESLGADVSWIPDSKSILIIK